MIAWRLARGLGLIGATALAALSCGESTRPDGDSAGPATNQILTVAAEPTGDCTPFPLFSIDPTQLARSGSVYGGMEIRWDFTNDGRRDTGFGPMAIIDEISLYPLPARTWTARCEIRSADGEVEGRTVSTPMPAWAPVTPDVVAGPSARAMKSESGEAIGDTIVAGRGFYACVERRDWLTGERQRTPMMACYVDGVMVAEELGARVTPRRNTCAYACIRVDHGILETGPHTITVVLDSRNDVVETNEDNNSVTYDVFVVDR